MRLDKWLKVSRLIKRRTVPNEACDKFIRRFRTVEELAPRALKECSLEELEALWAQAKSHPEAQA